MAKRPNRPPSGYRHLSIALSPFLFTAVNELANAAEVKMATIVRDAVEEYIEGARPRRRRPRPQEPA